MAIDRQRLYLPPINPALPPRRTFLFCQLWLRLPDASHEPSQSEKTNLYSCKIGTHPHG